MKFLPIYPASMIVARMKTLWKMVIDPWKQRFSNKVEIDLAKATKICKKWNRTREKRQRWEWFHHPMFRMFGADSGHIICRHLDAEVSTVCGAIHLEKCGHRSSAVRLLGSARCPVVKVSANPPEKKWFTEMFFRLWRSPHYAKYYPENQPMFLTLKGGSRSDSISAPKHCTLRLQSQPHLRIPAFLAGLFNICQKGLEHVPLKIMINWPWIDSIFLSWQIL